MSADEGPFMRRVSGFKKIGVAGRRSEKGFAKRMRGELTPNSGTVAGAKGDVRVDREERSFLIEAKSTKNDSMSVKFQWLLKINQEALEQDKTPAVAISFTNEHGVPLKRGNWVAIPEDVFKDLIGN